ncbi:uncharacterized protein [Argopecten irradians]|uniref:uncharacterized protein n=1 Tax=Argopecten irradians TaxID=31199 RepID=UPI003716F8D8
MESVIFQVIFFGLTELPTTSTPVTITTTEIPTPLCPKENVMNDTKVTEYLKEDSVLITVEDSQGKTNTTSTTFDKIDDLPSLVEEQNVPVKKITIRLDLTDLDDNQAAFFKEEPVPTIFVQYIVPRDEPNPEDVLTVNVTDDDGNTKSVDFILTNDDEDTLITAVVDIVDVNSLLIVIKPTTSSQTTTSPSEQPSNVGALVVDVCIKPVTSTSGTSTTALTTTELPTTSTPVTITTTEIPTPLCPKENVMNDTKVTEYLKEDSVLITVEDSQGKTNTTSTTFDKIDDLPSLVEEQNVPVKKITIRLDLTDLDDNQAAFFKEEPVPTIFCAIYRAKR